MRRFGITKKSDHDETYMEFYIGDSEISHHPLHFQNIWWKRHKSVGFPEIIILLAEKAKELSFKYNFTIEDICSYAFKINRKGKYENEILDELEDIILRKNLKTKGKEVALWEENLNFEEITIKDFDFKLRRETIGKDLERLAEQVITTKSTTGYCARELFMGLMIYLLSFNKTENGLNDIYQTLENPRRFVLRLSIMLDAQGAHIHPKGYKYLSDFIEINYTLIRPTVELLKKSIDQALPKLQNDDLQVIDFSDLEESSYLGNPNKGRKLIGSE